MTGGPTTPTGRGHVMDVGIDLDGVVYDYVGALRSHVLASTGRDPHTLAEPTDWHFASSWGMSDDEWQHHHDTAVAAGALFGEGAALPGAVGAVRALAQAGVRVHLITARGTEGDPERIEALTRSWLHRNGVVHTTLTFTTDKAAAGRSLGIHAAIDDAPFYRDQFAQVVGDSAYLCDQPWNRVINAPRVRDLVGFARVVLSD